MLAVSSLPCVVSLQAERQLICCVPGGGCAGSMSVSINCSPTERPRRRSDGAYSPHASSYDVLSDVFVSISQAKALRLPLWDCGANRCVTTHLVTTAPKAL